MRICIFVSVRACVYDMCIRANMHAGTGFSISLTHPCHKNHFYVSQWSRSTALGVWSASGHVM